MKTTILSLLTAAFLAVLPVNALAKDARGIYIVAGAGLDSCGTIVKEDSGDSYLKHLNRQWLLGYITAINLFVYDGKDVSGNTDVQGLYAWAIKYCRENPLDDWANAANALYWHLLERAKRY